MTDEASLAIECRLLQWLCQDGTDAPLRKQALSRLGSYRFRNVSHQILFECIRGIPSDDPESIQNLLPARLVRAGFPDFDLSPFFEPHGLSPQQAREHCESLIASESLQSGSAARKHSAGAIRWALLLALSAILPIAAAFAPVLARRQSQAPLSSPLSRVDSEHYRFLYRASDYSRDKVEAFATERESLFRAMAARLGLASSSVAIQFLLYATYEEKAAQGRDRGEFEAEPENSTVAAVWNETVQRVESSPDAQIVAEHAWGKPADPFLGLAVAAYAAGSWRGQPISRWTAQITWEEGPYSLGFLAEAGSNTGRDGEFLSPLVRRPLAGAFAQWVVSRWGLAGFQKLYSTAPAPIVTNAAGLLGLPAQELEAAWRAWLLEQAKRYSPPRARPSVAFFQRGVAFTQERWRDGGDYASARIGEVLTPLRSLGVDTISVSPFASMPAPDVPQLIRFAGESDEGIHNVTVQAHRLGLKVMLKPQIWLRGGRFAGDIHFENSRDRDLWFSRYRRWILHYARLAEGSGSDLFCIGSELIRMARYESEWRELIASVRRIYHGPITYAAHWGEEFETTRFWDALDYMGLNNYAPLTRTGDASSATLQRGAEELARRVGAVARRWRRRVIFTEVGFPSLRGAAAAPWKERTDAPVDSAEQAHAYEATFRAFYLQPWFSGMYWWKWYSTGEGGGPNDGLLTPMNKPAAQVMARWYQGNARRESP